MCDYSTEHLRNEKAEVGKTYVADVNRMGHGFFVPGSSVQSQGPIAACVRDGQRLALNGLKLHPMYQPVRNIFEHPGGVTFILTPEVRMQAQSIGFTPPSDTVVTVLQRRERIAWGDGKTLSKHAKAFAMWFQFNDFIEFADGNVVPVAMITTATMQVLPEQPQRDLDKLLAIEPARVPAARELIDA